MVHDRRTKVNGRLILIVYIRDILVVHRPNKIIKWTFNLGNL